ncbi:MAG: hypothetical protein ACREAY_10515 [Nitrososphaera sp.]|uniref:hypothetical protein n=1 Tax=Nitrososphaera sp. TaxID=1971748 RepID=UPI003D6E463D
MAGFCLRVKEEQERQLHVRRELYVGIRRDWARGTKILFVKKTLPGDVAIGSGTLGRIVELAQMGEDEKRLCLENNWYGKLAFLTIARFTVPVSETALAGQPPALLHGLAADVTAVEALARGRLVT